MTSDHSAMTVQQCSLVTVVLLPRGNSFKKKHLIGVAYSFRGQSIVIMAGVWWQAWQS
ncbi:hypothetical protein I79_005160 [Cricetulus griseus]|uniref:Uncharacterized protein n=1 Tax=Cricetulus griseus TaxID=10029 RepID=G3H4F9_CRIGR|nr:hypothetical protein I79_005160 [Cricetulus griseus]